MALGGVAHAAVLGPAAHQQDEVPRPRLDLSALGQQGRVAERRGAVHQEVEGHALALGRPDGEQCDLGLEGAEGGSPELEGAAGHQAVRADPRSHLLHPPGLGPHRLRLRRVADALLQAREGFGADAGHNLHFRHGNTEGRASCGIAASDAGDLGVREHVAHYLRHTLRELLHELLSLGCGLDLAHQLIDLRIEIRRLEGRRRDRLDAGRDAGRRPLAARGLPRRLKPAQGAGEPAAGARCGPAPRSRGGGGGAVHRGHGGPLLPTRRRWLAGRRPAVGATAAAAAGLGRLLQVGPVWHRRHRV
mmetsp:Transcript_119008/g.332041  ORF Transcript_119008/g.332041 Transcript_119008/m.332041 type:complete len:304 (+) Transcript_119008:706-1617(+)